MCHQRIRSVSLIVILALLLAACKSHEDSDQRDPYNIYLITASGLRASHLSSYLYQMAQTPAIDFLCYDGIRFLNAFSASPESLSAHLSLLSGIYPFRRPLQQTLNHFLLGTAAEAPNEAEYMPQWFYKQGYRTAAFLSDPELRLPDFFGRLFQEVWMGDKQIPLWQASYDTRTICKIARDWVLQNRSRSQFVLLNFAEPTLPFQPPPPYDRHYTGHPYDGELAALDEQIGLFVNTLKRAGLFDHSIIVFSSPFGESLNDAVRTGSVAEPTIRVPLCIVASGILPRHKEYESAVSLVDIFPTILTLIDQPHRLTFDGEALFQKGSDQEITRRLVFGETRVPCFFGRQAIYFARSKLGQFTTAETPEQSSSPLKKDLEHMLVEAGIPYPLAFQAGSDIQPGHLLENSIVLARQGQAERALELLDSFREDVTQSPFLEGYRQQLIQAKNEKSLTSSRPE